VAWAGALGFLTGGANVKIRDPPRGTEDCALTLHSPAGLASCTHTSTSRSVYVSAAQLRLSTAAATAAEIKLFGRAYWKEAFKRWRLEEVGCPLQGQIAGVMVKHEKHVETR
jgi:hypothetical protein